jgi:hypothetical protein
MLPGGDRDGFAPMPLDDNFDAGLVRPTAAVALNCRIATRPRRYDNTDSAPLFSLIRSGWRPSEQLPVSGSINAVCRSFWPRNQPNARIAPCGHSSPSSARDAARHAEMAAAASTGCWSNGAGAQRTLPKLAEPTGLKCPNDVVWIDMSQRSDLSPISTCDGVSVARPVSIRACESRALS